MRVFMKSARFGGAVALFVEAEDSVHQILAKAHILTQQPIDRLQLAYRGMLLHGPDRLATYGIEEDSILLVTKKTRMTVRWLETWQEYSYEGFAWTTVLAPHIVRMLAQRSPDSRGPWADAVWKSEIVKND